MRKKKNPVYLTQHDSTQLVAEIVALKAAANGSLASVAELIGMPRPTLYWVTKHPITLRTGEKILRAIAAYKSKIGVESLAPADAPAARAHHNGTQATSAAAAAIERTAPTMSLRLRSRIVAENVGPTGQEIQEKARELVSSWGLDALRLVMRIAAVEDDASTHA